jgi:hypothetical protein
MGNVGGCGGSGAAVENVAQFGAVESDFDIQEVIDAMDDESEAIQEIMDELKRRIGDRISKVFDIIREYLGSTGNNGSSAARSEAVDRMLSLLRERIPEDLQEIREIAKDLVLCPD